MLYEAYNIERVWASRSINSSPSKRGKLTEILVHNYVETKANPHGNNLQQNMEPIYAAEEIVDFAVNY